MKIIRYVIRYVQDHLELFSEYCHIAILMFEDHPICKKWSTPNHQDADKIFTSNLLLFVLAALKKDIFDKCDVNQTTRTC